MRIFKRISFHTAVAGSSINTVFEQWEMDAKTRPRFGRNWWFWTPTPRSNGGRLMRGRTTELSVHWLCFSATLTVYRDILL